MRKRAVTLGFLFVTSTCLFGGCIENDQSLTIVGAVAPDDDCAWQSIRICGGPGVRWTSDSGARVAW